MGDHTKDKIREMALERGFTEIVNKSESYEICFIPDNDYRGFLGRKREITGGNLVDRDGKVLGTHDGYPFFTIGQRKGLGYVAPDGKPRYVTRINPKTGDVTLGPERDLRQSTMELTNLNMINGEDLFMSNQLEVLANVRYRGPVSEAQLYYRLDKTILTFEHVIMSPAAGQSTVFYDRKDPTRVVGGAHIHRVIDWRHPE
jgi:tRNA-specific 2-thiouridylase